MDSLNITKNFAFQISSHLKFGIIDYLIFAILLTLSALIGVYYGFISKRKQNNTKEYLLGGSDMHSIPVAASLIASNISGVTLLAIPAEVYANGSQYALAFVPALVVAFWMLKVFLPIFHELKVTSCFEYLDRRFNRNVRLFTSFLYTFAVIIDVPVFIYAPALALQQVTGIHLHLITLILSVVCIFYTTVGGLRAVVWTDTFQLTIMIASILTLIYKGAQAVGGFCNVWDASDAGGRIFLSDFSSSPYMRSSFWTVSIGLSFLWTSNLGVNQSSVQRFLAVPDLKYARKSVWIFTAGYIGIKMSSVLMGLLIYAKYDDCDPVTTKAVARLDQIVPYYVMDVVGSIPGIPGLFIAGIFSAALSSMSSSLNTLSGIIFEDFIRPKRPQITELGASKLMKILVVVIGAVELLLVFCVEKMGAIFYSAISLNGATAGTLLGIFLIGMMSRKVNAKGIISGALASLACVMTIFLGSQLSGKQKPISLPVSIKGCTSEILKTFNSTNIIFSTTKIRKNMDTRDIFPIFKISSMYYAVIGVIVLFLISYPVSILTGGMKDFDEVLLAPFRRSKNYEKRTDIELVRKKRVYRKPLDVDDKRLSN